MILIGESINATIDVVNEAIVNKDAEFISKLAKVQNEAGAHYIDINAGTGKGNESEDLVWLAEVVSVAVNTPLCIDSSDPNALRAAAKIPQVPPIFNSISAEESKRKDMLPLIAEVPCKVIALAHGEGSIPESLEERMYFSQIIVNELRHAGLSDDSIFLDPILMGLSTNFLAGKSALETIAAFRKEYKDINIVLPLSNISFGVPGRSRINQTFMAMAATAGANAFILDIRQKHFSQMQIMLNLLLGNDKYCKKYIKAFKRNEFD